MHLEMVGDEPAAAAPSRLSFLITQPTAQGFGKTQSQSTERCSLEMEQASVQPPPLQPSLPGAPEGQTMQTALCMSLVHTARTTHFCICGMSLSSAPTKGFARTNHFKHVSVKSSSPARVV